VAFFQTSKLTIDYGMHMHYNLTVFLVTRKSVYLRHPPQPAEAERLSIAHGAGMNTEQCTNAPLQLPAVTHAKKSYLPVPLAQNNNSNVGSHVVNARLWIHTYVNAVIGAWRRGLAQVRGSSEVGT
jgi:hypothetical protein